MSNNNEISSFISDENYLEEDFNKSFSFMTVNDDSINESQIVNEDNFDIEKKEINEKDTQHKILINNNFNNKNINQYINNFNNNFQYNFNTPIPININNKSINNPFNNIKFNNNNSTDIKMYQNNLLSLINQINNNNNSNNNLFSNIIYPTVNIIYENKKKSKKKPLSIEINKDNKNNNYKNAINPENEIKIELIISGKEKRTCVRLFPIPKKYSPFDIIRLIDKYLKTIPGKRIYDSIYLPLTKILGKNIGYCFINLVNPKYVIEFYNIFNGLYFKNGKKPCSVIFSDKQTFENVSDPMRRPIVFKDFVKDN